MERTRSLRQVAKIAGLTAEETGLLVKLAVRVNFDLEAAKELHVSGKLSEAEVRVLDKLRASKGR